MFMRDLKMPFKKYKPDCFVRVCGDSPLIDTGLIEEAINIYKNNKADLVTNVFPRSFPKRTICRSDQNFFFLE